MMDEDWGELVLQGALDLISIHDLDGTYLYASPSSLMMLGYLPSELVGTDAYDHFHPDDLDPILESHTASSEQERTLVQYRVRRSDGRYVWFESQSRTIHTDDGRARIVVISRNIDHRPPDRARMV